jgi:hypothetical protein
MIANLTAATPVEIDTEIARIYDEQFEIAIQQERVIDSLERAAHSAQGKGYREPREEYSPEYIDRICNDGSVAEWDRRSIRDLDARLSRLQSQVAALREEMAPYAAEYRRRPWTRAFLAVTNGQGHVHSSMSCSTCNKMGRSTRFSWMVEFSGSTEEQIVEAAGERACTVCYPTAPAEVLNRPTQMFSPDEKAKQAAREEREAKRREREAAQVTLTVYTLRHRSGEVGLASVTWKTVRALQNDAGALVREVTGAYAQVNGFRLPLTEYNGVGRVSVNREEAFHNLRVMLDALKGRGVDTQALVAKNHKRAVKEGGRLWDGVLTAP